MFCDNRNLIKADYITHLHLKFIILRALSLFIKYTQNKMEDLFKICFEFYFLLLPNQKIERLIYDRAGQSKMIRLNLWDFKIECSYGLFQKV